MTRKLAKTCFAAGMMLLSSMASAQISHGGAPLFNHSKEGVKEVVLSTVDCRQLLLEDQQSGKGSALRVGVMQDTRISNLTDGTLTTLADGSRVWRIAIVSPEATHVSLHFSEFDIPEGAQLFVYDASGDFVIGAFTRENMMDDYLFHTQVIPGSTAVVEYREPAAVAGQGRLEINRVQHGYKALPMLFANEDKGSHGDAEGSCHINVKCPEGDDWRDEIRSVVCDQMVAGPYVFSCTGSLVNNTAQDHAPYILSAYHCQDLSAYGTISSWTFYFNYNTFTCEGNSGGVGNSMTGCDIKARYKADGGSDMLLVRLKQNIPDIYKPYYAGWDRATTLPTVGMAIHHPGGDFKKLTIPQRLQNYDANYHLAWWYTDHSKGVTEGGSSGSPLFNGSKHIVGMLHGGASSCTASSNAMYDLYGKFNVAWTGGGTTASRLKDWLDPTNSGVTYLDGSDYQDTPEAINEVNAIALKVYPNPTTDMLYLDIDEVGMAHYRVFSLDGRCLREGNTVLTTTAQAINLKGLAAGSYRVVLYTSTKSYSAQIIKQ